MSDFKFFSNSTPVSSKDIKAVEKLYGVDLPKALKKLIKKHNHASWSTPSNKVDSLISMSGKDQDGMLSGVYRVPSGYLPFADDGAEGVYAVDTSGRVVHFDQDLKKTDDSSSFDAFVESLMKGASVRDIGMTEAFERGFLDKCAELRGQICADLMSFDKQADAAEERRQFEAYNSRLPEHRFDEWWNYRPGVDDPRLARMIGARTANPDLAPTEQELSRKSLGMTLGNLLNNPLNVHYNGVRDPWLGAIWNPQVANIPDSEVGEDRFVTRAAGWRNGMRNIMAKLRKNYTPTEFVDDYARPRPEARKAYIDAIASTAGVSADQKIPFDDSTGEDLVKNLARTIYRQEQGSSVSDYDNGLIDKAYPHALRSIDWSGMLKSVVPARTTPPAIGSEYVDGNHDDAQLPDVLEQEK